MPKKRGALRKSIKYPGLDKRVNSRTRHELIDFDYVDKLSDTEKKWLSNFMEEWLSGNFNHEGRIFHKSKKSKRECYNRNNARNRDAMSIAQATGNMRYSADKAADAPMTNKAVPALDSVESSIIDLIDLKNADITPDLVEAVLYDDEASKGKTKRFKRKLKKKRKKLYKGNKRARSPK